MKKHVLFVATLLALGTAFVSCSKDEVVNNNTGVETPVAEGEQEIILQVANTGDELTSRAGRPLYSAEAKQNIDNVFIMIVNSEGTVVNTNLIENWMQVSADYSTNGHGKQYTWKLSGKDVLTAGDYFVYAIGYSNKSSYVYGTNETIADYVDAMTATSASFAKFKAKLANIKAEEFFAGEIATISVGDGGEFDLTANQTANVLTLHRQVTGVTGYYINVPTTTVENRGDVLKALVHETNGATNKTTYNEAIKDYKLRLVSSNCSNEIVAAAFNSRFTTTGENIDYVVNGHAVETITADAGFKGEESQTRYTVYEIKLGDWFPNGDVNGDGILGEEDYKLDADNWRKPTSMGNEVVGFQPGSVFGAEFLIPFLKTANTKTLELQLVGKAVKTNSDDSNKLEADGSETILRTWNINLASDDDQLGKDPQNGRKVYTVDWTATKDALTAYEPKKVDGEAYAETRESYSLVRNHLYSVGEKGTDEWDPDTDEPEDLSKGQSLILKVNDNWELIHKMEVE